MDTNVFQPASYVHSAIHDLTLLAIIGAALALLALVAFLLEWRTVVIGAITVPLALLAAVWALNALGYTVNALVVAGLLMSVGIVIDQAIATSEEMARVVRRRRAEGSDESSGTLILAASAAVRTPIAYATLIVLVTVTPVVVAQGIGATFVHPLALAYGLAVLAAMLVTLTVAIALGVLLYERSPGRRPGAVLGGRIREAYAATVRRTVRTPARVLLVSASHCGIGGWLMSSSQVTSQTQGRYQPIDAISDRPAMVR